MLGLRPSRLGLRLYSQAGKAASEAASELKAAAAPAAGVKVKRHEKHVVVDTKDQENLVPRAVPPLLPSECPKGNLVAHILNQYKGDTGVYNAPLKGWQKMLGENLIKTFNLDMDRIRSGPVAGALYRDQCKGQAYFEKGKPLTPYAQFYYQRLGMPQTYFQWFQITSLHMWMLYVRMRKMPRRYCREYQSKLVNGVFDDVDYNLREVIRVNSDRTVNNYKKRFNEQLKGSVFSYDESMLGGDTVLASALWRNLFERSDVVDMTILEHLVQYIRAQLYVLDRMSDLDFAAGRFRFLDPRCVYEPLTAEQNHALTEMIESARHEPGLAATHSKLSRDGW